MKKVLPPDRKRAGGVKHLPLFVLLVCGLAACGNFSMPNISMPKISMPKIGGDAPPPETPEQIAARVKPQLAILDVKPTALHAFNVTFRYDGNEALKRLVLTTQYQSDSFEAYVDGPIRSGAEFVARFKDSRIDTYRMNFASMSWGVKQAIQYEAGTYKNYGGGTNNGGYLKPRANAR